MPTATRRPQVAQVDDSAAGPASIGGEAIEQVIDEVSLAAQNDKYAKQNRVETKPFRQYQKKVIELAAVPSTHQTRQMASHVCGSVARLPFVPDDKLTIKDERGNDTTEFEQQVIKTAAFAEEQLGSEMVWTVSAQKLARAALELRAKDPDGSKDIAWVNDTRADEAGVLDE